MTAPKLRIVDESTTPLPPLPKKLAFTIPALTSAICLAGKDRTWIYDAKQPGLALRITSNGAKSFYFLKRVNGQLVKLQLGGFPMLHLDDARNAVAEHAAATARGEDVMAERRAAKSKMTLGELWDHYYEAHAKVHKRRPEEDKRQFDTFCDGWRSPKIDAIDRNEVAKLHAKIGKDNGHFAANRLVALLHKMFNIAADFGVTQNPAHGIQKFREAQRERFAGPDEMPRLLKAIDQAEAPFDHFFKLLLLTGARRSNVQSMKWEDVNLETKTWTIPAAEAKAHQAIQVPLVDEAVTIIKDRLAERKEGAEWVFPSHGKAGHLCEPKTAWKSVLDRAKITDLRIHDLRRTAGSWMAARGVSLPIIGKLLGHRNVQTTQIYARLNIDPIREALAGSTGAMMEAGKAKKGKKGKGKGK